MMAGLMTLVQLHIQLKFSPSRLMTLDQLAKEQSRAEALSAEVLQLSARLQQATQAFNGLARLNKPVLRNIESSLIKMKQDGPVTAVNAKANQLNPPFILNLVKVAHFYL
ncbi:uncharacterized protein [Malus domestica]|uniref:uncharacterized protein isoform X6 n=1 Tax=Malus domestica TaxID=3750 RepID=UPI000499003E|nr:uncharacterized protein LOC103450910 [Malus domestica]